MGRKVFLGKSIRNADEDSIGNSAFGVAEGRHAGLEKRERQTRGEAKPLNEGSRRRAPSAEQGPAGSERAAGDGR